MNYTKASLSSAVPEGAYEVDKEEEIANKLLRLGTGYDSGPEYLEENRHLHVFEDDRFHQEEVEVDCQESVEGEIAADVLLEAGGSVAAEVLELAFEQEPWRE